MISDTAFFRSLSSRTLTLVCLALAMLLVALGTIAQVSMGTFAAQRIFFNSFFIWGLFGDFKFPVFPGGLTVVLLWCVNLLASFWTRKNLYFIRPGLLMIHAGILLLLLGQVFTQLASEELMMPVNVQESINYAENQREYELAIIKRGIDTDKVLSIPFSLLQKDEILSHPALPFGLKSVEKYENSQLRSLKDGEAGFSKRGIGSRMVLERVSVQRRDDYHYPGVLLELVSRQGERLGRLVLSSEIAEPESFELNDEKVGFVLRPVRRYFPFSITLLKFSHDLYPGTEIPRNFSSLVRIYKPETRESREALIYMNHPLRYGGYAFYQASYGKDGRLSVFQVVRNPGWLLPYFSCALVTVGLLLEFAGRAMKRRANSRV